MTNHLNPKGQPDLDAIRQRTAHRLDNAPFSALLRGDERALAEALLSATAAARAYTVTLFGRRDRTICGQSAEDVASNALTKFITKVRTGALRDINLVGYLMTTVYHEFIDLTRRGKRETSLTGGDDDGNGSHGRALHVPGPGPTPEQAIVASEAFVARRAQLAMRRRAEAGERLHGWCVFPEQMRPLCRGRRTLGPVVAQLQAYVRVQLERAGARGASAAGSLPELAETVLPERVHLEGAAARAFLEERLEASENAVYQQLKRLKQVARNNHVAWPTGLMADVPSRGSRRSPDRRMSTLDLVSPPARLYTVGYGRWPASRRWPALVDALTAAKIDVLWDIRHSPCASALHPAHHYGPRPWHLQAGEQGIAHALRDAGIEYRWLAELGNPQKHDPGMAVLREHLANARDIWPARRGLALLKYLVCDERRRCCLLCACAEYATCHRRLVADALVAVAAGTEVVVVDLSSKPPASAPTR